MIFLNHGNVDQYIPIVSFEQGQLASQIGNWNPFRNRVIFILPD